MDSPPEVFKLRVAPRRHKGEAITLLITLALLFLLLVLLVGHPKPPTHEPFGVPTHTSAPR